MSIQGAAGERDRCCVSGALCRMGSGLLPVRIANLPPTCRTRVATASPQTVALAEGFMSVQVIRDAAILTAGLQRLESCLPHLGRRSCPRQLVPDTAVCCERESGNLKTASMH
jgi:hypothetical protein